MPTIPGWRGRIRRRTVPPPPEPAFVISRGERGPVRGIAAGSLPSIFLVALLVAGASGCAGSGEPGPAVPVPRAVRIHMPADPASLSLVGKTDRMADIVGVQIGDSLVQYDSQLEIRPRLAESWESSDDRRSLTFHLRSGLRWHDGQPVTADDVVFTVDRIRDPNVENRTVAPLLGDLLDVEALDPLTVRARYAVADPDAIDAWRFPILPRHVAGRDEDLLTGEFARRPIGCGPFRFVRYRRGEELVLDANDDYWDGRPRIDRLVFRIFPDQRTAYQALLSGQLDVMAAAPEMWHEAQRSAHAARLTGTIYYPLAIWHILWNTDAGNPFFGDARVRKALLIALDREAFIDKVHGGMARVAVTSFPPGSHWTADDLRPWPYDPAEARRLLEEAGWKDRDGDGVRDRDGRPFRFRLLIGGSIQQVADHMAAWQLQSWAEIGVRAEIDRLEFQQFRQRRSSGRFDAAEGSFHFTPVEDQYQLYHSTARQSGANYGGFTDAEVDRLLDLGRTTFDPVERKALYAKLQRRLHELQPMAALYHFGSPVLHDRRLVGIEPSGIDIYRTSRGPRIWRWVESSAGS